MLRNKNKKLKDNYKLNQTIFNNAKEKESQVLKQIEKNMR